MDYIKSCLKLTREAIKNKNYVEALKLSKLILKEDKLNYMALVFLGISMQEIGPIEQAPKAFHKAIQINSENVLAWNGLANYHEKIVMPNSKIELFKIYTKLSEIEIVDNKIMEICKKLIDLSTNNESSAINTIFKVFKSSKFENYLKISLSQLVINFLSGKEIPEDCTEAFDEMLTFLMTNSEIVTDSIYSEYLKILYKQNNFEQLLCEAEKMHDLYKINIVPLEWICKLYNEFKIEENIAADKIDSKIKDYCNELLGLQKESIMGIFTRGLILFDDKKYLESVEVLKKVLAMKPELLHASILITRCFIALHFYAEAVESVVKADMLLGSIDNSNQDLRRIIDVLLCNCLSKSTDKIHWERSAELCQMFLKEEPNNVLITSFLIESYINLEKNVEAKLWLSKLKEISNIEYSFLFAKLFKRQKKYAEALEILEKKVYDTYNYWLLLGEVYWVAGMPEKSLVPFLKAAKLDQNSYVCFMHLGNYYQKFGDDDKARRCYEKSFKINEKCTMAGIELSKIYSKQKNWDTNLNLLLSLTGRKIDSSNLWAYLQLGLQYLEQEDYQNAINSLRVVIRSDPDNSRCWESLADAYLGRGAYTAALKSFQRASELTPDSLYPMLQIANIKKLLGDYVGAKEEFENVLSINQTYVLALKGIAETCMYQARQYHRQQLHGLARDAAQYALEKISIAIEERSNISCLWKLAADSCYLVANLPEKYCCLLVVAALAEGKYEKRSVILEREELYKLAARCYCKSINLSNDNVLIYHDLSACYLSHATNINDKEVKEKLLLHAVASIQYCIKNNPTYWQHWNLLGNIAFVQEPKQLPLSQHAFIKAVTIERNSAIAWCNLANLYLYVGDFKLSNDAYSHAQRADPNYTNSWVGQALIAEAAGHEDAMDLFRHSTQLGVQNQGAIGYANWVCRTIIKAPTDKVIYSIHNMHAVPVALDALTWYTENNDEDPCAWNMIGLLRERMGLKEGALQAFRRALSLSSTLQRDYVSINYARSLVALGKYSKAVDIYRGVNEVTFNSGVGLALALFKDEQYEESYESYESALHCLTEEQGIQSDLLVALASMAYLFQSPEAAKTLLLQSTQLKPRSSWGLYATLSLGLLHDDLNLAKLVLNELHALQDDLTCLPHYAVLLTYTYLLQGEYTKAVRELSKLIHRHPDQGSVWLTLSVLLLRLNGERPVTSAAAKCAQNAMKFGQNNMDVTKVYCVVSLASLLLGDYTAALKSAQKSIHCYPDVAEGWAILLTVMSALGHVSRTQISLKIKLIFSHLKTTPEIKDWLLNYV